MTEGVDEIIQIRLQSVRLTLKQGYSRQDEVTLAAIGHGARFVHVE